MYMSISMKSHIVKYLNHAIFDNMALLDHYKYFRESILPSLPVYSLFIKSVDFVFFLSGVSYRYDT